jgi:acrylyl-CoA reductase (NADPH)
MADWFKALVLERDDEGTIASVRELSTDDLPAGDVLVEVAYSTLNYKDGLAVTGRAPIVRDFPFVPGIDFSGTVGASEHADFVPGQPVVLTGWGVGEKHWGGMARRARVKGDWLVPLPDGLTPLQAMAIGTAGFTAMLAVMDLERHGVGPGDGEILVTGAGGGVGSVAVALLAKLGHRVVAASGRRELDAYLGELGAAEVIDRTVLTAETKGPLTSARWAGAVDTVGGVTLAGLLKGMRYDAPVAVCGNAGGVELHTTVFPFILRGVKLLGIDSVFCPPDERRAAWQRLAHDLSLDRLDALTTVVPLADVPRMAEDILAGRVRGRTVIDVNA